MPSRHSNILAKKLAAEYKRIERQRRKIDSLVVSKHLTKKDAAKIYEGLFLGAHVAFENFIERLFLGLLVENQGVFSPRVEVVARVKIRSYKIARELVLGPDRSYIDWVPYDRTKKLALIYFRNGLPFSDLKQSHYDVMKKSFTIRNVIAHKSRQSQKQFEKAVIGSVPLPPNERHPAGYLMGVFRVHPPRTRFSQILNDLLNCALRLTSEKTD